MRVPTLKTYQQVDPETLYRVATPEAVEVKAGRTPNRDDHGQLRRVWFGSTGTIRKVR